MMTPMILALLWIIVASVIALLPWKIHKPCAVFFLIPTALLLIPLVYATDGPLVGTLFLLGVMSILRWPVYFLGKFLSEKTRELLGR